MCRGFQGPNCSRSLYELLAVSWIFLGRSWDARPRPGLQVAWPPLPGDPQAGGMVRQGGLEPSRRVTPLAMYQGGDLTPPRQRSRRWAFSCADLGSIWQVILAVTPTKQRGPGHVGRALAKDPQRLFSTFEPVHDFKHVLEETNKNHEIFQGKPKSKSRRRSKRRHLEG